MQPGNLGGGLDLSAILAQAQEMQQRMVAAHAELEAAEFTGDAGGGLVRATVSGTRELIGLVIDPKAVDPEDTETLADLIIAAVRTASAQAVEAEAQSMGPLPDFPGLPGLG